MENVTAYSAGGRHSLAVKGGRVWAWGKDENGQSSVPVAAQSGVAEVAAGGNFSLARKTDGSVVAWGAEIVTTNVPAGALSGVTQIAAGEWHALALKNGGILAWGSNTHNQCVVPIELESGVTAISGGGFFSMALKNGAVHVFGIAPGHSMEFGIRSVPAAASNGVTAISAGRWHALALKNGGVIAWGAPQFDATVVPGAATSGVVAISAGDQFSMALKNDGTIVVWGDDFNGQAAIPSFALTGVTGISAGGGHCLALCAEMPPRFISANLPFGVTNTPYLGSVTAAADPAATYSYFGLAPSWLHLNPATGVVTGIPPAVATYGFTLVASNLHGRATGEYSIVVFAVAPLPPVFVTPSPLPSGTVGAPYTLQIVASNNPVFSVVAGEGSGLPSGLNLSPGGLLSGTPTDAYNSFFMVRATNIAGASNRIYSIEITQPTNPPVFYTESPLPNGIVGQPYFVQIVASNNPTFSLFSGSLPGGLGLTAAGAVTGTPIQIESAEFTVRATNAVGESNRTYQIQVFGPPVFATSSPLPDASFGQPYSLQLQASGNPVYSLFAGSPPPGITLSPGGLLSGTPTALGPAVFTVRATNDYGWSNREFSLTVQQIPVFSTTSPLPTGSVGVAYSVQIQASGNPTFSLFSGSLPPGLNLSAAGLLSGLPTQAGPYAFTVRATNDFGWSNRPFDLFIEGYEQPWFVLIRNTNGNARLEWMNPNPGVGVQVWRTTNISIHPVPWVNLGVQTSPWTNTAPPRPSYYQLRLAP